jgi:hypothetical protein
VVAARAWLQVRTLEVIAAQLRSEISKGPALQVGPGAMGCADQHGQPAAHEPA